MAQDDQREKAQIELFNLENFSITNRGNQYWPDAKTIIDNQEVTIELKTKPQFTMQKGKLVRKTGVSTARGFGPKKAAEWKKKTDLFLFSETTGTKFTGDFNKHLVGTYKDIEPLIEKRVIKPFNEGRSASARSEGYFGYEEFLKKVMPTILEHGSLTQVDVKRLLHTIEVGTSLNDPKFSWKELEKVCVPIENKQDIINFWRTN